ncbi:unnamed protein product [Ixodes pacificus]
MTERLSKQDTANAVHNNNNKKSACFEEKRVHVVARAEDINHANSTAFLIASSPSSLLLFFSFSSGGWELKTKAETLTTISRACEWLYEPT